METGVVVRIDRHAITADVQIDNGPLLPGVPYTRLPPLLTRVAVMEQTPGGGDFIIGDHAGTDLRMLWHDSFMNVYPQVAGGPGYGDTNWMFAGPGYSGGSAEAPTAVQATTGRGDQGGIKVCTDTDDYPTTIPTAAAVGTAASVTSVTPAAFADEAGVFCVLMVVNRVAAGTANTPTITDAAMTWTQHTTSTFVAATLRFTLFYATNGITGSRSPTIDFAGQTQTQVSYQFLDCHFATGIVQTASNGGSALNGTCTLAAFSSANNGTLGFFAHLVVQGITPGGGFSEISDQGATQAFGLESEWKAANDTTVDASWATSTTWQGMAVELRARGVGRNVARLKKNGYYGLLGPTSREEQFALGQALWFATAVSIPDTTDPVGGGTYAAGLGVTEARVGLEYVATTSDELEFTTERVGFIARADIATNPGQWAGVARLASVDSFVYPAGQNTSGAGYQWLDMVVCSEWVAFWVDGDGPYRLDTNLPTTTSLQFACYVESLYDVATCLIVKESNAYRLVGDLTDPALFDAPPVDFFGVSL